MLGACIEMCGEKIFLETFDNHNSCPLVLPQKMMDKFCFYGNLNSAYKDPVVAQVITCLFAMLAI